MKLTDFYTTEGTWRTLDNGRIELRLFYRNSLGKRVRKSFSGGTLQECYLKAEEFIYKYKGLLCRPDSKIPDILKTKAQSDLKMNFIKKQSYDGRLVIIKMLEKHIIGHIPIASVTKEIIDDYLGTITSYSPGTIDSIFLMLTQAFAIAFDEEIIPKNLMQSQDMRKPKSNKVKKKVKAFTVEEQQLIESDLTNHKVPYGRYDHRNQLFIALYTGMRIGEVNALTIDDVDFAAGVIHIRKTLVKDGCKYKLGYETKTYAGIRDVPITQKVIPYLKSAIENAPDNEPGLLFFNKKENEVISPNNTSHVLRCSCRRCGIDPRGAHALRHTFATRCIESSIPAVVLKKWLGHTDIHVTLDTYAYVFDRMHNDAVEKFDEYMDSFSE